MIIFCLVVATDYSRASFFYLTPQKIVTSGYNFQKATNTVSGIRPMCQLASYLGPLSQNLIYLSSSVGCRALQDVVQRERSH